MPITGVHSEVSAKVIHRLIHRLVWHLRPLRASMQMCPEFAAGSDGAHSGRLCVLFDTVQKCKSAFVDVVTIEVFRKYDYLSSQCHSTKWRVNICKYYSLIGISLVLFVRTLVEQRTLWLCTSVEVLRAEPNTRYRMLVLTTFAGDLLKRFCTQFTVTGGSSSNDEKTSASK